MKIVPRIFFCYANEDKDRVQQIYRKLYELGLKPFNAPDDMLPSSEWERVINKMLRESDFVLVCCTKRSVDKSNFLQREIKASLEVAKETSEDQVYLIPARLEECEVPSRIAHTLPVDLFTNSGWTQLLQYIQNEMERRGATVTTNDKGRLVFETPQLGEQALPVDTNIQGEAFYNINKTQVLVIPWETRLKYIIGFLEKLFETEPDPKDGSHLLEMFNNLETLISTIGGLQLEQSWTNNLCVSFISSLLNRVVDKNALELQKLKEHQHCTLSFDATAGVLTGSLLSKHMLKMEEGDQYDVISDLASWQDNQLREFRSATKEAVENGVNVRRVFNVMLLGPEKPLSNSEKIEILEQHLKDSETWSNNYKGKYEVRVFSRVDLRRLKKKSALQRHKSIKEAHFGVFSHGKEDKTSVEYEVGEINLSDMKLWTDSNVIANHLDIFNLIWNESLPRTMVEIQKLPELKKPQKKGPN